jgi:NAD(P)-dependent dehydrogenase (short-subunit alcohol dehydrogenase family)
MSETPTATTGRLLGRRILITGAASGIGAATARRFAGEGARLALLDRDADGLTRIADELAAFSAIVGLNDELAIREAVAAAAGALGGLDGIVNVAGIGGDGRLEALTLEHWNNVLAVNLTAPMLVAREALPHLMASGGGTIVNISSGQGLKPSAPGMAAYCASKGGLVTLSKALALELAPLIRVNVICPGVIDTPLLPAGMREAAQTPQSPYALKRVAAASEIADAILFLTSAESSFITGIALAVDGGRTYH